VGHFDGDFMVLAARMDKTAFHGFRADLGVASRPGEKWCKVGNKVVGWSFRGVGWFFGILLSGGAGLHNWTRSVFFRA